MAKVRTGGPVQLFMNDVAMGKPAPRLEVPVRAMTPDEANDWRAVIRQARLVLSQHHLPMSVAQAERDVLKRMAVGCVGHAVFGPRGPSNPFSRLTGLSLTIAGTMIPTCYFKDLIIVANSCERLLAVWQEGQS